MDIGHVYINEKVDKSRYVTIPISLFPHSSTDAADETTKMFVLENNFN